MVANRPAKGPRPYPIPSGAPESAPEPRLGGRKAHDSEVRECQFQGMLRAIRISLFHFAMGRDRVEYRTLRRIGATPEEAMEAILGSALDRESREVLMAIYLPRGLSVETTRNLLQRYGLRPEAVAAQFQDRRRASSFLRRLGPEGAS